MFEEIAEITKQEWLGILLTIPMVFTAAFGFTFVALLCTLRNRK